MGIFSFLFKKPVLVEDTVFGKLTLDSTQGEFYSFLNEDFIFPATGNAISLSVETDSDGPTNAQKAFFGRINQNYSSLTAKLIPLIEKEFLAWSKSVKIVDFDLEFQLIGLSIPRIYASTVSWEWSFDSIHDKNHMLTISMVDDLPLPDICFDG